VRKRRRLARLKAIGGQRESQGERTWFSVKIRSESKSAKKAM
jgi:hypothetical protein